MVEEKKEMFNKHNKIDKLIKKSKQISPWGVIKTVCITLLATGIVLFPALGVFGSKKYSKAEQKIERLLAENGYNEKLELDKDEEKITEFMMTNENVSKEEYEEYNRALKEAKAGENILVGGVVAVTTGLTAGYIGAFAKLQEMSEKENREREF